MARSNFQLVRYSGVAPIDRDSRSDFFSKNPAADWVKVLWTQQTDEFGGSVLPNLSVRSTDLSHDGSSRR